MQRIRLFKARRQPWYTYGLVGVVLLGISGTIDHWGAQVAYGYFPTMWAKDLQPWHTLFYTVPKIILGISLGWWMLCLTMRRSMPWAARCDYYGRALLYALLLIGIVVLGKRLSNTSCPWDHVYYGGIVASTRWLWHGHGGIYYQCFPAGHATVGLVHLGWLYAPRCDKKGFLWAILAWGGCLATYQMLRGAHYLSHSLMTLWLALVLWEFCAQLPRRSGKEHT